MATPTLPLDQLDKESYLPPDRLEELLAQPLGEGLSTYDLDYLAAVKNYVNLIAVGLRPSVTVFQFNGCYRLLEEPELVSAYAYRGIKEIPVEILPPDSLEIPAYLRRSH